MTLLLIEWMNVLYRLAEADCFDKYGLQSAGKDTTERAFARDGIFCIRLRKRRTVLLFNFSYLPWPWFPRG
jgi:hypothetical protein